MTMVEGEDSGGGKELGSEARLGEAEEQLQGLNEVSAVEAGDRAGVVLFCLMQRQVSGATAIGEVLGAGLVGLGTVWGRP